MGAKHTTTTMSDSFVYPPKTDPFSVYVPLESLTEPVVRSIIEVVNSHKHLNWDCSERTLLIFLLAINNKLEEINSNEDTTGQKPDEHVLKTAQQIRNWLVDNNNTPLNWKKLREKYNTIANKHCDELARSYGYQRAEDYFELKIKPPHHGVKQSRGYMAKFRKEGFKPEELKVYWNVEQLENLCPKDGEEQSIILSHDPSDKDAVENLRQFPVSARKHAGKISYIHDGIEKAVFIVPEDDQIIVLNFANEQSPGGGYLRHAMAQEEVILYNSDGYRALLDLKYGRMGGGYAIPEFGLAYVRDICFFDAKDNEQYRRADMLVSACYCLNGAELYDNPVDDEQWKENNLAKFRAFMAAAVANTRGDGKNTHLLLGPIGTGAFGNDVSEIAKVFRDVLAEPMMNSQGPVRYAFENIWFVSIDKWKNDDFQKIIQEHVSNENNDH